MIRKQNGLTADREKMVVVWIGDQTSPSVPLKPKPNPEQGPDSLQSTKAEGGEEAAEEKPAASRGGFVRFKETQRCRVRQHVLMEKL